MLRVRTVRDIDDFAGAPGDPPDYATQVGELWESGRTQPQWCFILEDEGSRVGRIGFRVEPTTSDPAYLGSMPPEELFAFGFHLPWSGDFVTPGRRLLGTALAAITDRIPDLLEVRINPETHPHHEERCQLMEWCGLTLFQEKQGFWWVDDGTPIDVSDRLAFRSLAETGPDVFRAVMAPCGGGTLDRNDRYYWGGCGPDNWARQMLEYFDEGDADLWLIGYRGPEPVGYIAVSREEDWGGTIAHIGVVPEHRGNGYVHDLLAAGTAAARRAGIPSMLSDVDVLNRPMIEAMERAGHRPDARPWHVWVYRGPVRSIVERCSDQARRVCSRCKRASSV